MTMHRMRSSENAPVIILRNDVVTARRARRRGTLDSLEIPYAFLRRFPSVLRRLLLGVQVVQPATWDIQTNAKGVGTNVGARTKSSLKRANEELRMVGSDGVVMIA